MGITHKRTPIEPEDANRYLGAENEPLEYPGPRPDYSFVYNDGKVYYVSTENGLNVWDGNRFYYINNFLEQHGGLPLENRYAVLAVGSNACPGRLLEKFGDSIDVSIPVLRAQCEDIISLYMPWITLYGAIPATVVRQLGVKSQLWLTFLENNQFTMMNATEQLGETYSLVRLPDPILLEEGVQVTPVYGYSSRNILMVDNEPVRVASFKTDPLDWGRVMDERVVLSLVLDKLGVLEGLSVEERNMKLRHDHRLRSKINRRLLLECSSQDTGLSNYRIEPSNVKRAHLETI